MTDHVTHLTAKTVRHIFGWTFISTIIGGCTAALVTAAIRNHDYATMVIAGIVILFIAGIALVCS
jgi:hypothetical protein